MIQVKKHILVAFIAALLLALPAALYASEAPEPVVRPNIVFIMADDLGWADVAFHGGSTAENNDLKYPDDNCPNGRLTGNNAPWRGKKGDLYEGGTRVPTIVSWPDRVKPGKVDSPVQITDWMPTLCALAGYRADRNLKWDGTDVTPLLTQHTAIPDRPLYAVAPGWRSRSLRLGQWKLVVHGEKEARRVELFDLVADPSETRNLADDLPDRVRQLSAMLNEVSTRDRDAAVKD